MTATSLREEQAQILAQLGRSVLTEVAPHYIELIRSLIALAEDPGAAAGDPLMDELSAVCLAFGLPLMRGARMIAELGSELAEDQSDDPRVLLALVRTLGESYLSLAAIPAVDELPQAYASSPESVVALLKDPRVAAWVAAQSARARFTAGPPA